jgi:membrane-associated phospholipid phosphatase
LQNKQAKTFIFEVVVTINKKLSIVFFNNYHNLFLDILFKTITTCGEFIGFCISFLLLVFGSKKSNKKFIFTLMISALLSLLISQTCKHLLFSSEHRPSYFYNDLELVDGVDQHKNNSFPSGHTTAAFTFVTVLAFSTSKKWIHYLLPIFASRIYLGQHFLIDVVVGAILGIFIAIFSFYFFDRFWLNRNKDEISFG